MASDDASARPRKKKKRRPAGAARATTSDDGAASAQADGQTASAQADDDAASAQADGQATSAQADDDAASAQADGQTAHAALRGPPLDADGRERPWFVQGWPDDPALADLVSAFERGDYASVRTGAPELAARTEDPAVRRAALDLARRIEPAPGIRFLLGISLALLLFLTWWAYGHRH